MSELEKPMATIILTNFFIFITVSSIATFKGLDLKKRYSWMYGLYGFISGFLVGFIRANDGGGYHLVTNLIGSFQAGIAFALMVLVGGATTRWHRSIGEKYENLAERSFQEKLENLAQNLYKGKTDSK